MNCFRGKLLIFPLNVFKKEKSTEFITDPTRWNHLNEITSGLLVLFGMDRGFIVKNALTAPVKLEHTTHVLSKQYLPLFVISYAYGDVLRVCILHCIRLSKLSVFVLENN